MNPIQSLSYSYECIVKDNMNIDLPYIWRTALLNILYFPIIVLAIGIPIYALN